MRSRRPPTSSRSACSAPTTAAAGRSVRGRRWRGPSARASASSTSACRRAARRWPAVSTSWPTRAYFANTLLVCAANNVTGPSYPSLFAAVVSVAAHDVRGSRRLVLQPGAAGRVRRPRPRRRRRLARRRPDPGDRQLVRGAAPGRPGGADPRRATPTPARSRSRRCSRPRPTDPPDMKTPPGEAGRCRVGVRCRSGCYRTVLSAPVPSSSVGMASPPVTPGCAGSSRRAAPGSEEPVTLDVAAASMQVVRLALLVWPDEPSFGSSDLLVRHVDRPLPACRRVTAPDVPTVPPRRARRRCRGETAALSARRQARSAPVGRSAAAPRRPAAACAGRAGRPGRCRPGAAGRRPRSAAAGSVIVDRTTCWISGTTIVARSASAGTSSRVVSTSATTSAVRGLPVSAADLAEEVAGGHRRQAAVAVVRSGCRPSSSRRG